MSPIFHCIVFSTKYLQSLTNEAIENELYSYPGGICKTPGCPPIKIGGYYDHVHILCMLSKKIALMKLVEEIKSHSSKWIKTKDESLKKIYWQDGYGAFSVNPAEIDAVINYIANQKKHHTKKTSGMSTDPSRKNTRLNMMKDMFGINVTRFYGTRVGRFRYQGNSLREIDNPA